MSLKAFHVVFISASSALGVGCGVWELKNFWSPGGRTSDLLVGAGAILFGAALIVYERYFLKKTRNVSFL